MPWSKFDVDKHKKGLSDEQKAKWVSIANSVLEKDGDEAKAIRIANSQVGKSLDHVAKMWREDPTFRAMAMTYLGADDEVVKHLMGSHDQDNHDPTKRQSHGRKDHKGMRQRMREGKKTEVMSRKGKTKFRNANEKSFWSEVDPEEDEVFVRNGQMMAKKPDGSQVVFTAGPMGGSRGSHMTARDAENVKSQRKKQMLLGGAMLGAAGLGYAAQLRGQMGKQPLLEQWGFGKSDEPDFTAVGEFSKVDEDKQQVFGWASIVEKDGTPVVDLQGDFISPHDLEQAAYDYVLDSRVGGEMHQRVGKSAPKEVGTLIESMVITPEKVAKLGLPEGSLPTGWWVGYQVKDPQVWSKVKKGEYAGFSIHGYGKRKSISKEEVGKSHDVREALIAKALQFAQDQQSFAKNLWVTAQALEERGQRNEAVYFGKLAVSFAEVEPQPAQD